MIVDYRKIEQLLNKIPDEKEIVDILQKSKSLQRLSLAEVAMLLNVSDQNLLTKIFETAKEVKESIYGNRLVIFAPLYISNLCENECLYCAFRRSNHNVVRKALSQEEIIVETEALLRTGQKRVLLVSGEAYPQEGLDYVLKSIDSVYAAKVDGSSIRRVNVNIAPLEEDGFKRLKERNIGTFQLFQEVYHRPTYKKIHLAGQKADYDYRLSAIDRAFRAGIDDVGIGLLYGLYDYRYETLALMSHIEHLEAEFGMGPHTLSVPRLEPATGSEISQAPPYPVSDQDFKKIIAVLRLAVPYTGIILSTRETSSMRGEALDLGISQISAGSKTNPGGYSKKESMEQFSLGDHRSLDEVIADVCNHGYLPSFCTGCYRLGRTGLDFMEHAKPGDIKQKCLPNALVTFQEYLLDYATVKTKKLGENLLQQELAKLPSGVLERTSAMISKIKSGERDLFI